VETKGKEIKAMTTKARRSALYSQALPRAALYLAAPQAGLATDVSRIHQVSVVPHTAALAPSVVLADLAKATLGAQ
jgi:hypothetical protein